MTIKLSIVIPVFNKWNFTKSCLNDLSKLPNDHEIVIVDNASTDETNKELSGSTEITYIRNDQNLGFAKGCNKGYYHSSATIDGGSVLFLNNDIRVKHDHETWTKIILDKCHLGLVGPTMGQLDKDLNFVQEANRVLDGKSYMSGWCLASTRKIWNTLMIPRPKDDRLIVEMGWERNNDEYCQLFSEEFGLAYFEDTDLSFRARKQGIKFEVVDIPVVHFGKQTSQQLNTYQLYKQARQIFVKKWNK